MALNLKDVATMSMDDVYESILQETPLEQRLRWLTPEERIQGLTPDQIKAALSSEVFASLAGPRQAASLEFITRQLSSSLAHHLRFSFGLHLVTPLAI